MPTNIREEFPFGSSLQEDSRRYAASAGIPEAEAFIEAERPDEVNRLIGPIIDAHYSQVTATGSDGPRSSFLIFKDGIPPSAMATLAERPDTRLRGDAELSADEATKLAASISSDISESIDSAPATSSEFTVHVDARMGVAEIEVEATEPDSALAVTGSAAQDAADSSLTQGPRITIDIRRDPALPISDDAIRGGDKLAPRGSTSIECTAALPANSGMHAGLLTADHCRNDLSVDRGDKLHPATYTLSGAKGDAQWHRAHVSVTPIF